MLAERRHPLVGRIVPLDPRFTPRVSAADFFHNALCKISPPLFLMSSVLTRPLEFPNDADACRICAIALIRNYRARLMCRAVRGFTRANLNNLS